MTHYRTTFSAILLLASVASAAIAQETKGAKPPGIGSADEKQVTRIQENIKRMQQQMEQIRNPRDLKVRDRLLREHMSAMQENLYMMRGMGGNLLNAMTQASGSAGSAGSAGAATSTTDPSQRDHFLERRMDMMHMMMEQIVQHQEMMQSAPRIRKLTGGVP